MLRRSATVALVWVAYLVLANIIGSAAQALLVCYAVSCWLRGSRYLALTALLGGALLADATGVGELPIVTVTGVSAVAASQLIPTPWRAHQTPLRRLAAFLGATLGWRALSLAWLATTWLTRQGDQPRYQGLRLTLVGLGLATVWWLGHELRARTAPPRPAPPPYAPSA